MRVALDGMGGDHAPRATLEGACLAAEAGLHILVVGDEGVLREEAAALGGLHPHVHLHHASEIVEMEDGPTSSLRRKRDSSMRVAFELSRNGGADAMVTMGHSGAALATGIFVSKRLEGVLRPAMSAFFPGRGGPVVLLDVGANVDCRPEHLQQFAVMGAALAQVALGNPRPRVAILSNGEEEEKGTDLTRAAAALLRQTPSIAYVGYVEPKDVLDDRADVVVTDGWSGNILVKTAEAVFSSFATTLKQAAASSWMAQAGGALLRPALTEALAPFDWRQHGGALLLGVEGCAVVGHGRSDATAVASALQLAARLAEQGLTERVKAALRGGG